MYPKIKILIADHNKDFADLLRLRLSFDDRFFIVGIVQNGAQAIEILNHDKIDLILLDIILPQVDGLEILSQIKIMNFKTKAIVISALTVEKMISDTLARGAQYFLCKPFGFDNLISKINSIKFG